jgi:hypothetical protein
MFSKKEKENKMLNNINTSQKNKKVLFTKVKPKCSDIFYRYFIKSDINKYKAKLLEYLNIEGIVKNQITFELFYAENKVMYNKKLTEMRLGISVKTIIMYLQVIIQNSLKIKFWIIFII